MRVQIFRFRVSNAASCAFGEDMTAKWYKEQRQQLDDEEYIEDTINDFIKHKKNVQIIVTPVDVHYHNNARGNTIDLVYTIMFDDTPDYDN